MAWLWHFVTPNQEELAVRRQLLDRHGLYAQLSAIVPVLAYLLYRLSVWVFSEKQRVGQGYEALPSRTGSPSRKGNKLSSIGVLKSQWRLFSWWMEGEIYPKWGLRVHWIAGISWASWLLLLSIRQTGDGMCMNFLLLPLGHPGSEAFLSFSHVTTVQHFVRSERWPKKLDTQYPCYWEI